MDKAKLQELANEFAKGLKTQHWERVRNLRTLCFNSPWIQTQA